MKIFQIIFLLLLTVAAKAAPTTNVTLFWSDTNNFKPEVIQLISTNGGLPVVVRIPAITQMVYRVYQSTNLLTAIYQWPMVRQVIATNPGTNEITATFPLLSVAAFYTVTAVDQQGLESDFSLAVGVRPIPSPVFTGIRPTP